MTMHFACIRYPPQVKPFGVDLMICNHDQSFWEESLESSILRLQKLSPDALVPTDPYDGGTKPRSCCGCDKPERLLRESHISVVIVFVDKVERRAEDLGQMYGEDTSVDPKCECRQAEKLDRASMLDPACRVWFCCLSCDSGAEVRYGLWDCLTHDALGLFSESSLLHSLLV